MSFQRILLVSEKRDALVAMQSSSLLSSERSDHHEWQICEDSSRPHVITFVLKDRVFTEGDQNTKRTLISSGCNDHFNDEAIMRQELVEKIQTVRSASRRPCKFSSLVVDLNASSRVTSASGGWNRLETVRTNLALSRGTHRAVICKDPFYQPSVFGEVSEIVCDELSRLVILEPD
jgi:hypothetical protein